MTATKIHSIAIRIEDDTLLVQAYKLGVQDNEFVRTDQKVGKPFTCKIHAKQNREVVAYILDSENWDEIRTYWDGYYENEYSTYLTIGNPPARVTAWVDKLPAYEITIGGN